MKLFTIIKSLIVLLFLVLMVFFVFENNDPVHVWIPFFKGRHIGLIYIMLAFYVIGITNALWVVAFIGAERRKRMKLQNVPVTEQSLFEDEA